MKYLKQLLIILLFSLIGELLHYLIPLPIPASIYGLILLLFALISGLVKLEMVKDAGNFLIEIMPIMFIPAGVGLITSWETLKPVIIPVIIIMIISTVMVMGVSGKVTQIIIKRNRK